MTFSNLRGRACMKTSIAWKLYDWFQIMCIVREVKPCKTFSCVVAIVISQQWNLCWKTILMRDHPSLSKAFYTLSIMSSCPCVQFVPHVTRGQLQVLCQLTTPLPTLSPSHPFHLAWLKHADPPAEVSQQAWVRSYLCQIFLPMWTPGVHHKQLYSRRFCLCEHPKCP